MADELDGLDDLAERERRAGAEAARKAATEPRAPVYACIDGCGAAAEPPRVRCAWCHDEFVRKQARRR